MFWLSCWDFSLTHFPPRSEKHYHELEQRIQSLQDELNKARASKRRRVPSDEDTDLEHVQPSEASGSELPSQRNVTAGASFEAEADRGDGEGGSYTLKNPKGAMRFFGEYLTRRLSFLNGCTNGWADSTGYSQAHPLTFRSFLLKV